VHQSSFNIMRKFRDRLETERPTGALALLDVGSYGVNGTYREIFSDVTRFRYTGLDLQPGPNVDCVPRDPYHWPELADESFDVIISGQAFEHMEFPWLAIDEMGRKLKKNGLVCIVAPSRGPQHRYPVDCWRYYPDGLKALARWAGLTVLEAETFWGETGFADGSDQWGDSFCILRKDSSQKPAREGASRPAPMPNRAHRDNPLETGKTGAYYSFIRTDVINTLVKIGIAPRRVLEIGCAGGGTGKKLREILKIDHYAGVEISDAAASAARQHLDQVILADIERADLIAAGLAEGDYDLLLALDVLEHLVDPWEALARLVRHIKPGGHLVVSLPNIQNITVVDNLVKGGWRYEAAGILDATHLRFFTLPEMERLLTGAGLKVTTTERVLNPPLDLAAVKDTGNNINLGKLHLTDLTRDEVLRFFTYQYILVAELPAVAVVVERKPAPDLVSMVILTFNQLETTQECVVSIKKHTPEPHEIIFVDNGSTDGTVPWLRELAATDATCRVIENPTNFGFAKGCNQGIAASRGDEILLLNNDVVVTPKWLSGMLTCLKSRPDAGFVGPMTNNISGPQKLDAADYASTQDGLDDFAARFRAQNLGRRIPMRRIVGFCMLFHRALIDKVGVLDERFGSGNYEDDDYCLRAALLGYTNLVAGDVFIHHYGSKSFTGNGLNFGACMAGNRKLFTEKWNGIPMSTPLGQRLRTLQAIENGRDLHARGSANEAVEALLRGLKQVPGDRDLCRSLAELLIEDKHCQEALDALAQMPPDETDRESLLLAGTCEAALDHLVEAGDHADRVLAQNPGSAAAMNLKGIVAHKRGDQEQAADWCRQAIAADPGYAEPHTNLGVLEWAAGRQEPALTLLERGCVLAPTVQDLVAPYHSAVSALGEWRRAERVFAEARSLHPTNRRLTFLLIDALLQQGKHAEAMTIIEGAMALFGIDDGMLTAALDVRTKAGLRQLVPHRVQRHPLSVCMIVKNEENNLPRCLTSLKPIASEIIVVDTGSTDRSRDVATAFGAKVFDHSWTGDFSEARNLSLAKASGDWILVMDADEVLSPQDYPALVEMTHGKGKRRAAWSFVTRNYVVPVYTAGWTANTGACAREEAGTGWFPSTKVRLFPNDRRIRFANPVHELVEPSLRAIKLPVREGRVPVHHYGKLDQERDLVKGEAYYDLGVKKLEEQGESVDALRELATQAAGLKKHEEAVSLWQRALRLEPNLAIAYLNLAPLYLELDRFPDALAAAKRAMELTPTVKEATYNTALCELYAGSAERSATLLDELVRQAPDYPSAPVLRSLALCCAGKKEAGMGLMKSLRTMDFGFAQTLTSFARKLVSAGRLDHASGLLDAAVESGNITDELVTLRSECKSMTASA
jgi:O-antigen biosynthesis protein